MSIPSISIHAENIKLRTAVQKLETNLLNVAKANMSLRNENEKLQVLLAAQILQNTALRHLLSPKG